MGESGEIRLPDRENEVYTAERCFIIELLNTAADPGVSVARARVLPGITTRWHRVRGISERYLILSGRGRAEVGTEPPREVGPGDVVLIAPEAPQRITNVGLNDLIFLAICTPRFRQEAYEDIDPEPLLPEGTH